MGRKRLYSDEESRKKRNEAVMKWIENNPQKSRANSLLTNYRRNDKIYNRGECTLTAGWIIENIFSKPCVHCGESDWRKIGCNRLDNTKPHTPDNVEPCCRRCNRELQGGTRLKQVYQYTTGGTLVNIYGSTSEAAMKNGFNQGNISSCCNGKYKTAKGYIWRYNPMN